MLDVSSHRTIRVIAPSYSLATIPASVRAVGTARLESLGFRVELGAHVDEIGMHRSASVEHRLADFEAAVGDPSVDIVMAAQGGCSSNQLLERIDYAQVQRSNKVFLGFSDISALLLALGKQANASVIHGPTFSELCNPILPMYTVKGLLACLAGRRVEYLAPGAVSDEVWCSDEPSPSEGHRLFEGWRVLRGGEASGLIVGGNLVTVALLAGTRHFPETAGRILFLEDAAGEAPGAIHRELVHLAQLGMFEDLAAFMFGMVPAGTPLASPRRLKAILDDVLPARATYPVVTEVSCSHLSPMLSIPLFRPAQLDLGRAPRLVVNSDAPGEPLRVLGSDALAQSA